MAKMKKDDFKAALRSVVRRVKKARKKGQKIKYNLTLAHLLKLWNRQGGLCTLCGMELDLKGRTHQPRIAPDMRISVDRTDPSLGYVRGNVSLQHMACNRFKGTLPESYVYAIACRIIENYRAKNPGTTVEIDRRLRKTADNREYMYPEFSFVSSGKTGKKLGGSADSSMKAND